ncbi:MAG TPA: DUF2752 domain-containing protein [Vicinamibacterales bacterium]
MTVCWRRLRDHELDHERLWLAVGGASLLLLAIAVASPNVRLPLCTLKVLTGIPCPTCGMTRAVLALTRGDFLLALTMNPLVVVGAIVAACYGVYAAAVLALGLPRFRPQLNARDWVAVRVVALAAMALNWAWLIADGR